MQQSNGTRRGARGAALVLAAGLGPGAVVLPAPAAAAIDVERPGAVVEDQAAVQRLVVAEAVRNRAVPTSLALAVVEVESGFVPRTVGTSGAIGLMQILPAVAKHELAVEGEADVDALFDAVTNLRVGLGRLAHLHDRYGGDWELALSHFRGGELRRDAGRYHAHGYTQDYVARVMRCWRRYQRDPLVRAWIREASGAPRFVSDDTFSHVEDRVTQTGPAIRWEGAAVPVRPRHHRRVHERYLAGPCWETIPARGPNGRRFGRGGGRRTAIEGAPFPAYRFGGGRWVAITGGPRFR